MSDIDKGDINDTILNRVFPLIPKRENGKNPAKCMSCDKILKNQRRQERVEHILKCDPKMLQDEILKYQIKNTITPKVKSQANLNSYFYSKPNLPKTLQKSQSTAKTLRKPTSDERRELLANLIFNAAHHAINYCVTKAIIPLQEESRRRGVEQPGVCPKTLRKYVIQAANLMVGHILRNVFVGTELFLAFDVWSSKHKSVLVTSVQGFKTIESLRGGKLKKLNLIKEEFVSGSFSYSGGKGEDQFEAMKYRLIFSFFSPEAKKRLSSCQFQVRFFNEFREKMAWVPHGRFLTGSM